MINTKKSYLELMLDFVKDESHLIHRDKIGRTPLYYATCRGNLDNMKALLDRKIPANESLHVVARQLDVRAIRLLLQYGADANSLGVRTWIAGHLWLKSFIKLMRGPISLVSDKL